jgi:Zn-finger nucleic acid-binding protein
MPNADGPMACPVDGSTLVMSERSGIEIDYCPQCRGVWLDRGELDKIIERNAESAPISASPPPRQQQPHGQQASWGHQPQGHFGQHKPHKKRRSFLEDLFD